MAVSHQTPSKSKWGEVLQMRKEKLVQALRILICVLWVLYLLTAKAC